MDKKYFLKEISKYEFKDESHTKDFPIRIFPDNVQFIINTLDVLAQFEKQIVSASVLFSVSTIIGNSRLIEIKGTWKDTPNLWVAIVGKRGTMKSPTINYCLKPLMNEEKQFHIEFQKDIAKWLEIPKKNRKDEERPMRTQRFSNDTTVEGLIQAMTYNYNGMGIYKDELNGFFEEMNRYKSGGNLEFYLSAFNGGTYIKNRKSYDPQTVNDIYLSMLGSIQPEVLKMLAATLTNNGMMDRWLYVISEDRIQHSIQDDIPGEVLNEYNMFMQNIIYNCAERKIMQWMPGAKESFFETLNELEELMKDENLEPFMFTYISKLKTYFARFITIITTIQNSIYIGIPQVNMAKELVLYFYLTAQKTFIGFENQITVDKIYKIENATTNKEKVFAILKHLPEINNSQISRLSNISRPTVIKYVKLYTMGVKSDLIENETVN